MWHLMARFIRSQLFRTLIIVVILLSSALIGLQTNPDLVARNIRLLAILEGIILVFIIEFVLKVLAEGSKPWRFF